MHLTALRIPDDLSAKIEHVARRLQRSKSYVIRKAIEEYLTEYIDYEIALGRLNEKNDRILTRREMRRVVEK